MPKTSKLRKVARELDEPKASAEQLRPVMFTLSPDIAAELEGGRKKRDDETSEGIGTIKKSLEDTVSSFAKYRESTNQAIMRHRTLGSTENRALKAELDGIVKELEDAFMELWPKFDEFAKGIADGKTAGTTIGKRVAAAEAKHEELGKQIVELSARLEKRYQSALKKLNDAKKNVEIRTDDQETKAIRKELERLEKLIKKAQTYEYGSQLQVFVAGALAGQTNGVNLIPGEGVTISGVPNGQGFMDITITAPGAGVSELSELTDVDVSGVEEGQLLQFDGSKWVPYTLVIPTVQEDVFNEQVSGSGTSFTLEVTPISGTERIYVRGQRVFPGPSGGYEISGPNIVTADTLSAGDVFADYQKPI